MPYQIIGRKTYQIGKPLWEILSNLKNFGVGRMIIRGTQQRYSEPCYYRILQVDAMAPEGEVRRVKVLTDRVFRGKYYGQAELHKQTYKPDFQLVHKCDEGRLSGMADGELPPGVTADILLPATAPPPPLLREVVLQSLKEKGKPLEEPVMRLKYCMHVNSKYRVAEENEVPMVEITCKPVRRYPEMYMKVKE